MAWEDWREANREWWDTVTPAHLEGGFYDVPGFLAGRDPLRPFEVEELGPVDGLDLVHLQCHFGLDTLSWARRGARVVGLDFSAPAIDAARSLAAEAGLSDRAEFVRADVFDAAAALGGRDFDVVYTGLGALVWIGDLDRWADVACGLVRPGGVLYLAEFHPITDAMGDDDTVFERGYFDHGRAPLSCAGDVDYGSDAPLAAPATTYEWIHPVSEVLGALLGRGLVLELFSEHDHTLFRRWPFLEEVGGVFRLPEGRPSIPLMYSLRARRPAPG